MAGRTALSACLRQISRPQTAARLTGTVRYNQTDAAPQSDATSTPPPPPASDATSVSAAPKPTAEVPPPPPLVNELASEEMAYEDLKYKVQTGRSRRTIEHMPFATYQLALEVLKKDRQEKIKKIQLEQQRIERVKQNMEDGPEKTTVLRSMTKKLDELKVFADINNPRVKFNFDSGNYTLDKPIYRYLADRKWRVLKRPTLMQRLEQMNIVPDIVPSINPVADVELRFGGAVIQPGRILSSGLTEKRPTIKVIPFTPGEKLVTIAVVNPDVPDPENDSFTYQLHWLVSNVPVSHLQHQAIGTGSKKADTIHEYLVPTVQKGIKYARFAVFVMEQEAKLDADKLKTLIKRESFNTRRFLAKNKCEIIGAHMWRNTWDEQMKDVMIRHNIPGWDKMYRRVKV